MQSKPLEASPVVSNTTLAHDRLGGVVRALVQPDFKIGDRVECIETEDACGHYHVGSEGTVENTELDDGTRIMRVYVCCTCWQVDELNALLSTAGCNQPALTL